MYDGEKKLGQGVGMYVGLLGGKSDHENSHEKVMKLRQSNLLDTIMFDGKIS